MNIELRKFNLLDKFRILILTLNKEYSKETQNTFFSYSFKMLKSIFKKENIYEFAILVDGQFGGNIGLTKREEEISELGYQVLKKFRNKGVATKAVKQILQFGFKKLKLKKVIAITDKGNLASERVLKKLKFTLKKKDKKSKEFIWEKRQT